MKMKTLAVNKCLMKPGYDPEIKLCEEMAELIQAILKFREKRTARKAIARNKEMSDVFFNFIAYMFKSGVTKKQLVKIAFEETKERFPEELEGLK